MNCSPLTVCVCVSYHNVPEYILDFNPSPLLKHGITVLINNSTLFLWASGRFASSSDTLSWVLSMHINFLWIIGASLPLHALIVQTLLLSHTTNPLNIWNKELETLHTHAYFYQGVREGGQSRHFQTRSGIITLSSPTLYWRWHGGIIQSLLWFTSSQFLCVHKLSQHLMEKNQQIMRTVVQQQNNCVCRWLSVLLYCNFGSHVSRFNRTQ